MTRPHFLGARLRGVFGRARPTAFSMAAGCEIMLGRVMSLRRTLPEANAPHVGVFITPWLNTAVSFVSLEVACVLREAGCRVTLIDHALKLPFLTHPGFAEESALLSKLVSECAKRFDIARVADVAADHDSSFDFGPLIFENAVWSNKGEALAIEEMPKLKPLEEKLRREHTRVRTALAQRKLDWALIPGGVFGVSGLYTQACRDLGLGFFTYDCGSGEIKLCLDDIAAQNGDLPGVFQYFMSRPADELRQCESMAWEWVERREQGRDDLSLQPQQTDPVREGNFALLCLNYRADTAALLRNDLFPTVIDWVRAVATWAVRSGRRVIVRQHPCEKLPKFRSTDDLGAVVHAADPSGNFARFVSAHDPVNTYDLMRAAACVLPFTSRVGIEAAMLGRPVILGSKVFYRGLGFTHDADTEQHYFTAIEEAISGRLKVGQEQRRRAAIAYFAVSEQTRIKTLLTAIPADFMKWSAVPRAELWSRPELSELRSALLERKYFAVARHEARGFSAANAAAVAS